MKKIISFAAALALAGAQPYMTAFSAETSVSDTVSHVQRGEFLISSESAVSVTNGKFTFSYDPDRLKLESADFGQAFAGKTAHIYTEKPGRAVFAFASADPFTVTPDDCFAKITVTPVNGHEENFFDLCALSFDELCTDDESGKSTEADTKNINLVQLFQWPVFELNNPVTDSDGKTSVTLSAAVNPGITNGIITVKYDSDKLKYTGFDNTELLGTACCEANETEPGTIVFVFASAGLISGAGDLMQLNFTASESCTSKITVTVNEMFNTLPDGYPVYLGKDYSVEYDIKAEIPGSSTGPQTPPAVSPVPKMCDVNDDGIVSTADLIVLARMLAGLDEITPAGDVNCSGNTDLSDLLDLLYVIRS